jgi:hypothetical protein
MGVWSAAGKILAPSPCAGCAGEGRGEGDPGDPGSLPLRLNRSAVLSDGRPGLLL